MQSIVDKVKRGVSSGYSMIVHKVGSRNALFLIVGVLILLFAGGYIYKLLSGQVKLESFENGSGKKQAELMLFYANWCPHCKTAKPEWNALKDASSGKSINGYNVLFTEVDCTDKTNEDARQKCDKFGVEGFPTIFLLKDGQKINFESKPTKENLEEFLQVNLSS